MTAHARPPALRARSSRALRCGYCADAIPREVAHLVNRCAGCGVFVHRVCTHELAHCPTLGCAVEFAPKQPQEPAAPGSWRARVFSAIAVGYACAVGIGFLLGGEGSWTSAQLLASASFLLIAGALALRSWPEWRS